MKRVVARERGGNSIFRKSNCIALIALGGGLSGCVGMSFYDVEATGQYPVDAPGALRATPMSHDGLTFKLGETSVRFVSAWSRTGIHYGFPLTGMAAAGVKPVTPGRSYSFAFSVDPGPASLAIIRLDAFRIRLDGAPALLEPTHYEIEYGDGSCMYIAETRQLRAFGAGCFVTVFYTEVEHVLPRHTLIPAPVESDEVLYILPDIVFE